MRIAICLFKYFPFGGIPRDAMKIAREAASRGHEVRFYTLRWEDELPEDFTVSVAPIEGMFNHVRYARFAPWLAQQMRLDKIDLVLGMNKMPGLDVYYAGDSCFEDKARSQRSWFYRLTPRYRHFSNFERAVFSAESNTTILTISPVQPAAFSHHYGTQAERFVPLPPGIDPSRAATQVPAGARDECRAELGVGEDEHLIAFVGSGFIKKGLDRLLIAMHTLPEEFAPRVKLAIIGQDRGDAFERMVMRLGIQSRVAFLGGRDDVPRWLQAADAFVLPAYDETAGMVILEAMIAGLPVLVTDNCGYAPYVSECDGGLVCPTPFDSAQFNDLLVEILTSDQREAWRRNARALADNPDIYRLAEAAVDALEDVARRKR